MAIKHRFKLFFFIVFALVTYKSECQVNDSIKNNIDIYFPFDTVVSRIEHKFNVRFFYNQDWFEGKVFTQYVTQLSFDETISLLKKLTQLNIIRLNNTDFVFVPPSFGNEKKADHPDDIIVGNMLDYGRKPKGLIHAKIVDGKSKQPLPGATIVFSDLNKTISTDYEGRFTNEIVVGDHIIKITYPGYEENVKKLKVLSDGEIVIEMFEKAIKLNEVIITADMIDQNFRRTQMSVLKFNSKGIKELPAIVGEPDVLKSMSLLPGIQTSGEFGTGFNVRGGGIDQNLILVEDVPIFNTAHLFGLSSILNSDGITNISLYKAGIPATYGERASSVLDIRLGSENLTKFRARGGIGLFNSRLMLEIPVKKKLTIMLGGRSTYSDWLLKQMPDVDLRSSSAGFYDLNCLVSYNINQNNKLTLFGYSSNDRFGFSGGQNYNYGNILGSMRYSHRFGSKLYSCLVLGVSSYNSGLSEKDTLKPYESYIIDNSVLYRNLKWTMIWEMNEKHVLTGGINGFLYNVNPGKLSPYNDSSKVKGKTLQEENGLEWAAYVSDDYKMNDKLSFEIGLRFSHYRSLGGHRVVKSQDSLSTFLPFDTKTYSGIEPRISVRYNLINKSSLRFSYTRINQYINLVSNTAVITPTDLWKLSNTYVTPLISQQFALGYFKNFKDNGIETSVEIYYKNLKNTIDYINGAKILLNELVELDLTTAKGKNYGFEIYVKKNYGKLNGWISYTFSRAIRQTGSVEPLYQINKNTPYPSSFDRPHNLVINGGYYYNRRWRFALVFNYNSGRPVTLPELKYMFSGQQVVYYSDRNKYRMPAYHRLDISVSCYETLRLKQKWKGFWTFSLINLYARKNAYSIFYQRDTRTYEFFGNKFNLYKLYIIGKPLPTLTYNFTF